MGKADALSRREDHTEGMEDDNKGVLVIPTQHIQNTIRITTDAEEILKRIKKATKMLKELGITRLCNEQNMIKEDELLFDQNGRSTSLMIMILK